MTEKISKKRLFCGLVAAAAVPLLPVWGVLVSLGLTVAGMDKPVSDSEFYQIVLRTLPVSGILSFVITAIFALPSHYFLKRFHYTSALSYTGVALIIGTVICLVLNAILGNAFFGIVLIGIFMIVSAVSGFLFWLVVYRLRKKHAAIA